MGSTVVCIWKILPQMGEGTSRKCVYVRVETERPWDEMVVVVVVVVAVGVSEHQIPNSPRRAYTGARRFETDATQVRSEQENSLSIHES